MVLKVQHGGWVRSSFVISSTETTIWSAGRVLKVNSSGEVEVHDSSASGIVGLALENRVDLTATGPTTTETVGTPSGEQAALLVDEAFIEEDDQLASGAVFAAGSSVYTTDGGLLTQTATVNRILGTASAAAVANAGESLAFLFSVQY